MIVCRQDFTMSISCTNELNARLLNASQANDQSVNVHWP